MAFISLCRGPLRVAASGCWLLAAVSGCIRIQTVVQDVVADNELVAFEADVPEAPPSMPLYQLTTVRAPLRLGQRECQANERTGENTCYEPDAWLPKCADPPKPGQPPDPQACGEATNPRAALAAARGMLSSEFVPKDGASKLVLERGRVLSHARVRLDAQGKWQQVAGARPWLVIASARRTLGGYGVDGPGSRAVVAAKNAPVAALRTWKSAAQAGDVKSKHLSHAEVRAEISRQLVALNPRTPVHVQRIELVYYDANAELIQPAYRFIAEFSSDRSVIGRSEHLVGYVAYADTAEPLPLLSDSDLQRPASSTPPAPPPAGAVRIGRYVVQDDNKGWVRDANAFMDTLLAPGAVIPFSSSQYEDAAPEQFTSQSAQFVNSVDIALVEAHGAPWQFATERNCCKTVQFSEPEFPAYGAAAGGSLKHLVLHSCDVLPVKPDLANWANPWKHIFKGLHSVLGYRSPMYINDGAGAAFARNLAAGAPVVPAWFCAVTSLNIYQLGPSTHHRCEGELPMGRPAAVTACGVGNETAQENAAIEPDCLDAWWIDDALVTEQE